MPKPIVTASNEASRNGSASAGALTRVTPSAGATPAGDLGDGRPADDRSRDLRLPDRLRVDGEDVPVQDDEVGELAGGDRALLLLLELGVGRAEGVGLDRLRERDLLLRNPAVRVFAV